MHLQNETARLWQGERVSNVDLLAGVIDTEHSPFALAAWSYPEAWDMLQFGMRLGRHPQSIVTTTPKPVKLIRDLLAREGSGPGKGVVVTRGRTSDNAANLPPVFLEAIQRRYGGTRLGRQELEGEFLEDVPGALWQRAWIDRDRVKTLPDLTRIVISIDPAVSNNEGSDETGIIAAGKAADGDAYVLADASGHYGPLEWAQKAIALYHSLKADRIVAEVNQGGAMVEATLRAVDPTIPYTAVTASRGKVIRAEPVSALYEQGRVHHHGAFDTLEDQLCSFTSDFSRSEAGYSPDRLDALVWAITELSPSGGFNPDVWVRAFAD
jgi:phage terminase large subunit-like protein